MTADTNSLIATVLFPETAAMLMRQHWRLGDKPIKNMVHLLEANAVRVFSLAENTKAVDAFSLWRDATSHMCS